MNAQHPLAQAEELFDLAMTYVQDGAFLTAAERLRAAADCLEQHGRNCYGDGPIATERPQPPATRRVRKALGGAERPA